MRAALLVLLLPLALLGCQGKDDETTDAPREPVDTDASPPTPAPTECPDGRPLQVFDDTLATGIRRGERAADFSLGTRDGRFTLSEQWNGCDQYGFLPAIQRQRATILKPGSMFISQPRLPVPLLIEFPFPAWATRAAEADLSVGAVGQRQRPRETSDPFDGLS